MSCLRAERRSLRVLLSILTMRLADFV